MYSLSAVCLQKVQKVHTSVSSTQYQTKLISKNQIKSMFPIDLKSSIDSVLSSMSILLQIPDGNYMIFNVKYQVSIIKH